jgi:hypothetical protein
MSFCSRRRRWSRKRRIGEKEGSSWRVKRDNIWDCTDLAWLGAKLAELREEQIAGRCCIHWKFMKAGMQPC